MTVAIQRERQHDFLSFIVALIILVGLIVAWHSDVCEYPLGKPIVKEQSELWTADSTWTGGWR